MSGRYRVRVLPDLVTQRLWLTPVVEDDLYFMRALNADEEVMRNLTGRPAVREETDAEWSQRLQDRSDHQRAWATGLVESQATSSDGGDSVPSHGTRTQRISDTGYKHRTGASAWRPTAALPC